MPKAAAYAQSEGGGSFVLPAHVPGRRTIFTDVIPDSGLIYAIRDMSPEPEYDI